MISLEMRSLHMSEDSFVTIRHKRERDTRCRRNAFPNAQLISFRHFDRTSASAVSSV